MRIENNWTIKNQYWGNQQEVRPAKTLQEVQQAKTDWETTDRFELSNYSILISDENLAQAESGAESSLGKVNTTAISSTDRQRTMQTEAQVRAHEAAHKAAAGQFAGPIIYHYAVGADGKRYIVGGEVSIHAPVGRTPEETIRNMEKVKRAALAPGDPSPQDMAVAAQATIKIMQARQEMAREKISGEETSTSGIDLISSAEPEIMGAGSEAVNTASVELTPEITFKEKAAEQEALEKEVISQESIKKRILEYQQLIKCLQAQKSSSGKGATLDLIA